MKTKFFCIALFFLFAGDAIAVCSPNKTLKVVTRIDAPEFPADHFARRPKTLYRLGEKYGRIEEELNPLTGLHLLIVVNEPDMWMVNRADKTGQHAVDPGPTYRFRAPALGAVKSDHWNSFEVGCEVPFMENVKGVRKTTDDTGTVRYEYEAEGVKASLLVGKNRIPQQLTVTTADDRYTVLYDVYEQSADADTTLFQKPEGIAFVEANQ